MTKYFTFSKRLHWATLCCFLFPFFYTGCGPSAEDKATMEKAKQDSIAAVTGQTETESPDSAKTTILDSTKHEEIAEVDTSTEQTSILQPDTTTSKTEKESKTPSQKISNQLGFLRPILVPKQDTYTGVATVIDGIPFIPYFSIFISFLFLIISLVVKFIDSNARKTIVLLDILALISLFVSQPYSFDSEKLWGFWVAMTFVFALSVYDIYVIRRSKTE